VDTDADAFFFIGDPQFLQNDAAGGLIPPHVEQVLPAAAGEEDWMGALFSNLCPHFLQNFAVETFTVLHVGLGHCMKTPFLFIIVFVVTENDKSFDFRLGEKSSRKNVSMLENFRNNRGRPSESGIQINSLKQE
jgi:hypothetical protein